ncbi:V-set domain containing T-cell activation inhibitor 1 [Betta splendens]|uniref:V-set domain containing T-cell activation inhibitor 1 n=1 Tax=Betta splendens TaxID=158456 RepID=A0A6P7LGI5_BETSP|nr:V-set domain containing T-cell activation inhibitor 1 [Betta splendens]
MAALSQIIFYSMVTLILVFSALIILILALTFTKSSPRVMSSDAAPVANLGRDELLSCFLSTSSSAAALAQVSVTWERKDLSALVYKFDNGAPDLAKQAPQYKDRTQVFPGQLVSGNASLLLRSVRSGDGGVYTCTISSSGGGGTVNINLRAAAFSAPTFNVSGDALRALAGGWLPEPDVTWADAAGRPLSANTSVELSAAGTFSVASALPSVNASSTYTCSIHSRLVAAVSEATVAQDYSVSAKTEFYFGAAPSLLAPAYLNIITSVLCIYS